MREELPGHRVELWQGNCLAIDWILTSSFDWREMCNELARFGSARPPCCRPPFTASAACAFQAAHSLSHAEPRFAWQLHRRLDWMHAEQIARVRSLSESEVSRLCHEEELGQSEELGGLLWALLSDPRLAVTMAAGLLFVRLHYQAIDGFANHGAPRPGPVVRR